ncbi:hypothetical protein Lfu02_36100 [Longispora fulva]|uniref:Uncharacterized protein n=1 Tax=Longispora fulva TaxID=619741 RepID=A0A8J7GL42_9ACTN|nr:endonuclease/exonuclease/phosphatase family protein [Longispora fulva]MBG6141609.1 hypothetical protein [Longispora fulva]GIG59238.1 hypothetical protein Lfu02_36100 [Longispora fulva]
MAGTLTLSAATVPQGSPVTFGCSTDKPASKNWVGLYAQPGNGPVNQKYVGASTAYQYVPGATGSGSFDTAALAPGTYVLYFLANDGYVWLAPPVTFTVTGATPVSTLTLTTPDPVAGDPVTFRYTTTAPHAKNWVGLYTDPGNAPSGGHSNGPSTVWKYVTDREGTVTFDGSTFYPGRFVALLLAKDGYSALAGPVPFTVGEPGRPVRPDFLTDVFTSRNVRAGERFSLKIGGLWTGPATTFAKAGGDSWLSVGADGTIEGRAPLTAPLRPATVVVAAGDARLTVRVPVCPVDAKVVDKLRVMSWELWDGGSHVTDAVRKQARILLTNNVDVVGVQGAPGSAVAALAGMLGWEYAAGDGVGVLSRYPVTGRPAQGVGSATAVTIRLDDRQPFDVAVWSAAPASPAQGSALLAAMADDLAAAARRPVLLASSGGAVDPALLRDSYRLGRPDPGATWSPVRPTETPERRDFVHFAGDLRVEETHVLVTGWPRPVPDHAGNRWPSDHAAVVTTLRIH